jgi:pimeloyl-ACP methyl ester carboxylesterase
MTAMMTMLMAAIFLGATVPDKGDPIDAYIAWSRGELKAAGLARKVTADGSVYWVWEPASAGSVPAKAGTHTLVLLHGVNDQAGTWAQVVPLLKSDYRLIIPDLAGHGESEPKTGTITFAEMLKRLHAIVAAEGSGKAIVAGNSMGGWIAMLYALEHPEKVERLVLEDSSGMAWDLTGVPLSPKNREEADAMMRAVHGPETKTPDDVLDAFLARKNPPMSRIALPDVVSHLVDARLKDLKVPVTLVWGRNDGILSLKYAKALHEKIPGSTLSIIDGAAHIPHRQQPGKFVQCLKATC